MPEESAFLWWCGVAAAVALLASAPARAEAIAAPIPAIPPPATTTSTESDFIDQAWRSARIARGEWKFPRVTSRTGMAFPRRVSIAIRSCMMAIESRPASNRSESI